MPFVNKSKKFSKILCHLVIMLHLKSIHAGDVAQMVERSLSMREVRGSIPCISNCLLNFYSVPKMSNISLRVIFFSKYPTGG